MGIVWNCYHRNSYRSASKVTALAVQELVDTDGPSFRLCVDRACKKTRLRMRFDVVPWFRPMFLERLKHVSQKVMAEQS